MTPKKVKDGQGDPETATGTAPDTEAAPVTRETPPEGKEEAPPEEAPGEADGAATATETGGDAPASLTSSHVPPEQHRTPAYCGVCGAPLSVTTTPIDRGFDHFSGAPLEPGKRVVLECPTGRIFHTKYESIDGGKWQVPG